MPLILVILNNVFDGIRGFSVFSKQFQFIVVAFYPTPRICRSAVGRSRSCQDRDVIGRAFSSWRKMLDGVGSTWYWDDVLFA
jgi:hypothetical protein